MICNCWEAAKARSHGLWLYKLTTRQCGNLGYNTTSQACLCPSCFRAKVIFLTQTHCMAQEKSVENVVTRPVYALSPCSLASSSTSSATRTSRGFDPRTGPTMPALSSWSISLPARL